MNKFAHLHLNTEFSLKHSAVRMDKLFEECDRRGITAVAMTDHNNLYGAVEFIKAAAKYSDSSLYYMDFIEKRMPFKVKPIIGCELTVKCGEEQSVVLLCKNRNGYLSLVKLASEAALNGEPYKPCTELAQIKKYYDGLICIACVGADDILKELKGIFSDDLYLELTAHGESGDIVKTIETAQKHGIKAVATNDVHYIDKDDAWAQQAMVALSKKETISPERTGGEYYLKTYDEMASALPDSGDALATALEIADKCDPYVLCRESLMPVFVTPDGQSSERYLRSLVESGLAACYKEVTPEIRERAETELSLIIERGYADYFLVVWDYVHFAEEKGIPVGPGRGAACGSIVCYALGITKVDPLKYGLVYERFMNPERTFVPDIDIDFCFERRSEVAEYITAKYGSAKVAHVVTVSRLQMRSAISYSANVLGLPHSKVEAIYKAIPNDIWRPSIALLLGKEKRYGEDVSAPKLIELYNNRPEIHDILDLAEQLEGLAWLTGTHAAGLIIAPDAINNYVPLFRDGDNYAVTQYDMMAVEDLGLFKFDLLGLRALTNIQKTCKLVKETTGQEIDMGNINYADPDVYALFATGDTDDIFQFESKGMQEFIKELKPDCIGDIIAAISMYRPGPIEYIPEFISNKKNPDSVIYAHPKLKAVLKDTYGVLVYQEQLMNILHELAGYSLGQADIIRRTMAKRKQDMVEKEREAFITGCGFSGISEDAADTIYDMLIEKSPYLFNKSHAAAYATITYQCAYLKAHYTNKFRKVFESNDRP